VKQGHGRKNCRCLISTGAVKARPSATPMVSPILAPTYILPIAKSFAILPLHNFTVGGKRHGQKAASRHRIFFWRPFCLIFSRSTTCRRYSLHRYCHAGEHTISAWQQPANFMPHCRVEPRGVS
jgi:hypothetical protein